MTTCRPRWVHDPHFAVVPGRNSAWRVAKMGRLSYSACEVITVPLGYVTDFATVPRLLRWLVPVDGKHRLAALVHDVCYDYRLMPRKEADQLFLKLMLHDGVRPITAYAMYGVVRIFGKGYTQNVKA